ncbi:MAG: hypothetical protein LCH54_03925 [Bacteroidetes bacterium]|nr:hypothetical protein [Bacteroidota bacterium]
MIPSFLKSFILKAELLRRFRSFSLFFFSLFALALLSSVFFQDQLMPVGVRWAFFSLLLSLCLVLIFIYTFLVWRSVRKFKQQLKPLELEEVLSGFSSMNQQQRNQFLNLYFLPGFDSPETPLSLRKRNPAENRILLISAVLVVLFFTSLFFLGKGWHDLLLPWTKSAHMTDLYFTISPGTIKIERGDTLNIHAEYFNSPSPVYLSIEKSGGNPEKITSPDNRNLIYSYPNLQENLSYQLQNDWFRSDVYSVKVVDRPFLSKFVLALVPPVYTRQPSATHTLQNGNQVRIPEGTRLSLTAGSSKDPVSFILDGWKKQPLSFSGSSIQVEQPVFSDFRFRFLISDRDSLNNRDSSWFSVSVIKDEFPTISVQMASDFTNRDLTIPLRISSTDDYGILRFLIQYRIRSEFDLIEPLWTTAPLISPQTINTGFSSAIVWPVPDKNLIPGDWVEFKIGVADNYPFLQGGHLTWSEILTVETPTIDESFKQADSLTTSLISELNKVKEQTETLKKNIEKNLDDIRKKGGQLSFTEQAELGKMQDQKKNLDQHMDDLQKKMDKQFQELNKTQTLPPETLQKYLELQKLIQESKNPKIQEMLNRLQDSMDKLDRNNVLEAMKNLKMDNESLNKQLEQSIETVKRLQLEQKFEEFSQKTRQLAQDQQKIQANLQKDQPETDKAASQQNLQTDKLEDLEKQVSEMEKKASDLSEQKNLPKKEMAELREFFEKNKLAQKSKSVENNLNQKKNEQAKNESQELSQKLQELNKKSGDMQQAFQENQNMIILTMLRQLLLKANQWSELAGTPLPGRDPARWGASYSDQLSQTLRFISDSASAIAAREPQLGLLLTRDLESISTSMIQAKTQFADGQTGAAELSRIAARTQVNGLIYRILNLMSQKANQQQGQGGQGDQQKSFFDEMRDLANRQQGLNQQVMDEQGKKSGQKQGPSQERLSQMAAQQEAIRQQLQDLMQRAAATQQNTGLASQLSQVEKEMEKASKELIENIDSKVIERQQKILSRMLDSQRSTIEREFEEKRESFSNKKEFKPSDFQLKYEQKSSEKVIELQRNLDQFNSTYQNFIRQYYQFRQPEN